MTTTPSTSDFGYPEAARKLGVPVHVLRDAIFAGKIPAPAQRHATAALSADWLDRARAAVKQSPAALHRVHAKNAAPFARYEGTSAWRKYANRVREFAHFQARTKAG